jgi:hypothetical protein
MSNHENTSSPSFDAFRAAVTQAMADIVAGDSSATWRLHELSAPAVRAMAFGEARRIGVWLSDDDLEEVHIDVTLDLARRARSWSPGGALPWNWARRRVLSMGRPAVTVGADHDMNPAAVRKVVQRINQRLAGPGPDLGFAA